MKKKKKARPRRKRVKHEKWLVTQGLQNRANVEVIGSKMIFKCKECEKTWDVRLLDHGGFPDNFLNCPNGCNSDELKLKEV